MRFRERGTTIGAMAASLVVLGLASCGGEKLTTVDPITNPADLFTRLEIDRSAVTMALAAPYDTLQLTATPLNALGKPMPGLPAPTFRLANLGDTINVTVSPEGLLRARQSVTGVLVIADLAVPGNVRHIDTAMVNVTSDPPAAPLDTLFFTSDSTIWPLFPPSLYTVNANNGQSGFTGDTTSFYGYVFYAFGIVGFQPSIFDLQSRVHVLDAAGNPMAIAANGSPGLAIEYRSLEPDVALINVMLPLSRWSGQGQAVLPRRAGQVHIVMRATAYGVTKTDTVTFTVTPPTFTAIVMPRSVNTTPVSQVTSLFGPDQVIRRYGTVMWMNTLDRPVDLVFDNSTGIELPAPALCDLATLVTNFIVQALLGNPPGISPDTGPHCPAAVGSVTVPQPSGTPPGRIDFWKTAQLLQFTQTGVYTYHDAQTGASGRIVVTD